MDKSDPFAVDVQSYLVVNQIAIEELVDMALGSNIARRHHLESAVDCFADIQKLLDAEAIIRELFSDAEVDEPDATHDDTRDNGSDA
jgi:hypothetical protein